MVRVGILNSDSIRYDDIDISSYAKFLLNQGVVEGLTPSIDGSNIVVSPGIGLILCTRSNGDTILAPISIKAAESIALENNKILSISIDQVNVDNPSINTNRNNIAKLTLSDTLPSNAIKLGDISSGGVLTIDKDLSSITEEILSRDMSFAGQIIFEQSPKIPDPEEEDDAVNLRKLLEVEANLGTVKRLSQSGELGVSVVANELLILTGGVLMKASASNISTLPNDQILRISQIAGNIGDIIPYTILGQHQGFTGLTPGQPYYIGNTPGTISLIPGTNEYYVGEPTNSTTLNVSDPRTTISYIQPSSNLIYSDPTAKTSTNNVSPGTLLYSVRVFTAGTYKFTCDAYRTSGTASVNLGRNGVGTIENQINITGASYSEYTFDKYLNAGDILDIYGQRNSSGQTLYVQNIKLSGSGVHQSPAKRVFKIL